MSLSLFISFSNQTSNTNINAITMQPLINTLMRAAIEDPALEEVITGRYTALVYVKWFIGIRGFIELSL